METILRGLGEINRIIKKISGVERFKTKGYAREK